MLRFFMKDPNTVSESYNLNQAPSKVSPRKYLILVKKANYT